MLKQAIEKIEEMAKLQIVEKGGRTFAVCAGGESFEVGEFIPVTSTLMLSSLDAVAKLVRTEGLSRYKGSPIYITVPSHQSVCVFIQPYGDEQDCIREEPYNAKATDVPGWDAQVTLPFDQAAVALQTRFQDSEDRAYTLQLLSSITTGAKITYNDIGVATTIVTQKGVSLQQQSVVRPLVKLRPYRTFQEVEQPEGLFLIRINERGITFTEADGGMWKLTARRTVAAYFESAFAAEIADGRVVVAL